MDKQQQQQQQLLAKELFSLQITKFRRERIIPDPIPDNRRNTYSHL